MSNTKEIKRRIKSVKNTKQITHAMELVSAVKMKRAQDKALTSRPYADLGWEMLLHAVSGSMERIGTLLGVPGGAMKTLCIVAASDRGLCGGFNANIFRTLEEALKDTDPADVVYVAVGKKAQDYLRRRRRNIAAAFGGFDASPHLTEVRPIMRVIIDEWKKSEYRRAILLVNGFISTTVQRPLVKQLLPFGVHAISAFERGREHLSSDAVFSFEPSPETILTALAERLLEVQIYQAILESGASEHSARMIAMHNATQNSNELMKDLQFSYNRSRQENITREIAEISSAAESMK